MFRTLFTTSCRQPSVKVTVGTVGEEREEREVTDSLTVGWVLGTCGKGGEGVYV